MESANAGKDLADDMEVVNDKFDDNQHSPTSPIAKRARVPVFTGRVIDQDKYTEAAPKQC
jgi:hypothetical protein